ncbi:hypothetical protein IBX73_03140 [candidate division WOR-3 bacterium]|nr:hypothetical protein [candidate division WOR-3 bacterium]
MIFFLLISYLVFQRGDTLQFVEHGAGVETVILADSAVDDSLGLSLVRRGRVSDDNRFFFIYEAIERSEDEVLSSRISFYDAGKNLRWEESAEGPRKIAFELSGVSNGRFIIGTWDEYCGYPEVRLITGTDTVEIIQEGDWHQVLDYDVSPNGKYFVYYTRNPHFNKIWDYIYFFELSTRNSWDYLLPVCLSCKRLRVELGVDDDGRSEVIYNNEHRIFSKLGTLEDFFFGVR